MMTKSRKSQKKPTPAFERPWIDAFPYRSLASRTQNPATADAELRAFLPGGCVVAYIDELDRTHVMEGRVYGLTAGGRPLLIGYQVEHGLVREHVWKAIERVDRIFILERDVQLIERTAPCQHASRFTEIFALAPNTALDLTKHEAEGY